MPKGASRSAEVKVWSCGNEHCPKHRYWPRSHLYLEDYEHFVWGSDKKFRTGEDSCRMPQYLYRAELGPGTKLSPKKCQKPILTVKGGTELNWRVSSVGIEKRRKLRATDTARHLTGLDTPIEESVPEV